MPLSRSMVTSAFAGFLPRISLVQSYSGKMVVTISSLSLFKLGAEQAESPAPIRKDARSIGKDFFIVVPLRFRVQRNSMHWDGYFDEEQSLQSP